MSHLLWKSYWENDVDRFRRLLAPASSGYHAQISSRSPGIGVGNFGHGGGGSPSVHGTSPRATKSRKSSGYGTWTGAGSGSGGAAGVLGKAEVNARDAAGLTILLRAASSTDPRAAEFVRVLLAHPAVDLYAQDPESGWNALHRALYAGNVATARLLLEKERRDLAGETLGLGGGGPIGKAGAVGLLIKTKDHEGNSPFDLYNSTIGARTLLVAERSFDEDDGSESDSAEEDGSSRSVVADCSLLSLAVVDKVQDLQSFGVTLRLCSR